VVAAMGVNHYSPVTNLIFHSSAAKTGKANVPDLDIDFEGNGVVHVPEILCLLS
jgi:hypothetical protein